MSEEIKEILDKLKDTADTSFFAVCGSQEELDKMSKSITKILSIPSKDAKLLYDYITNLQEENEMLKLEIERLNDVLVHKPDEKITLKTNDGQEMFIIQSERIDMQEELNKANMELMIKLEDYKSRNEKAIEYINTHYLNANEPELLNILQGVDKE